MQIRRPNAKLNINDFLFNNNVILEDLDLYGGVTNVHFDKTGNFNWDIFPSGSEATVDTTETPLDSLFNAVDIKKITIHSGRVNYLNEQDTQQVAILNAGAQLSGSLMEKNLISDVKFDLQDVDFKDNQMHVVFPKLDLNLTTSTNFKDCKIRLQTTIDKIFFDYEDEILLNNPSMKLTLTAEYFSTDQKISIEEGAFTINQIPFKLSGDIRMKDSSYFPQLAFGLEKIKYSQIHELLPKPYEKMLADYATINDGKIYCNGTISGCYSNHSMPDVDMKLGLQHLNMRVKGIRMRIDTLNFISDMALRINDLKSSKLTVHEFYYSGGLGKALASAVVTGFTENPHIETELNADLNLRRLNRMFLRESDFRTRGSIDAKFKGSFDLDDVMNMAFEKINAEGRINIDSVFIRNPKDTINAFIDLARFRFGSQADDDTSTTATAATTTTTRRRGRNANTMFRVSVRLDSMDVNYKGQYVAKVGRFSSNYRCDKPSPDAVTTQTGRVNFRDLNVRVVKDRTRIRAGRTSVNLRITPNSEKSSSPVGSLKVNLDGLFFRQGRMAVQLNHSELNLALKPQETRVRTPRTGGGGRRNRAAVTDTNTAEGRKQARLDRMKVMSSDQFIEHLMTYATSADTNIAEKFMTDFAMESTLVFDTFRLRMPEFPLPIRVLSTEVGLSPRSIALKNAQILMGNTDMVVTGTLNNFKRAIFNNGTLRGNVSVQSHKVDCNQLMYAMSYDPATDTLRRRRRRNLSDSTSSRAQRSRASSERQVQEAPPPPPPPPVVAEVSEETEDDKMFEVELEETEEASLFMIPRTLNLTMNAEIDTLIFGKSTLTELRGEAEMRGQHLRLNKFQINNGAGQMNVSLAYKARTMKEAKCWVDVQIDKASIQELLKLYPEMDTMMPITRSFEGVVDCSLTARTMLDSAMNADLNQTKATCNLRGDNLVLLDGETFTEISKTLMFKNKERNIIDSLSVDLVIDDGKIEIFPFKLTMDRYDLAVGGIQNLDMSFDYHITVLSSPVPFKMGIDISGTMDKFKTRIVSPKYKKMDSPAMSIELRDRTLNVQREFKRILDYEFEEIIGGQQRQ